MGPNTKSRAPVSFARARDSDAPESGGKIREARLLRIFEEGVAAYVRPSDAERHWQLGGLERALQPEPFRQLQRMMEQGGKGENRKVCTRPCADARGGVYSCTLHLARTNAGTHSGAQLPAFPQCTQMLLTQHVPNELPAHIQCTLISHLLTQGIYV